MSNVLCYQCQYKEDCKINCPALIALTRIAETQQAEQKTALIEQYAKEIGLVKFEIAPDLEELGHKVLSAFSEFAHILNNGVRISYLKSFDTKKSNGKTVFAECRIVKGMWTAYLPFDFVITFFHPAIYGMTENQLKILMLHELKHIGLNHKGYYLVPHDIEDFADILSKYGLGWNHFNSDVPDILSGIE